MPFSILISAIVMQAPSNAPPPQHGEVVVIGRRSAATLERCLAEKCPPAAEVAAALDAAGEYFQNGKYEESKSVLWKAVERNKKYAAQIPREISELYTTRAVVSLHYGDNGNA